MFLMFFFCMRNGASFSLFSTCVHLLRSFLYQSVRGCCASYCAKKNEKCILHTNTKNNHSFSHLKILSVHNEKHKKNGEEKTKKVYKNEHNSRMRAIFYHVLSVINQHTYTRHRAREKDRKKMAFITRQSKVVFILCAFIHVFGLFFCFVCFSHHCQYFKLCFCR